MRDLSVSRVTLITKPNRQKNGGSQTETPRCSAQQKTESLPLLAMTEVFPLAQCNDSRCIGPLIELLLLNGGSETEEIE